MCSVLVWFVVSVLCGTFLLDSGPNMVYMHFITMTFVCLDLSFCLTASGVWLCQVIHYIEVGIDLTAILLHQPSVMVTPA